MILGVDRVVDCPDCHRYCHWCAWWAKNARGSGCGASGKRKCEWQEMKGTVCPTCGGNEKMRLVGQYKPVPEGFEKNGRIA